MRLICLIEPTLAKVLRFQRREPLDQNMTKVYQLSAWKFGLARGPHMLAMLIAVLMGTCCGTHAQLHAQEPSNNIKEAGRLAAEINDLRTLASPEALKLLQDQYNALTPEQFTPLGTQYRVDHFGGQRLPPEDNDLPLPKQGEIDEITGAVKTSEIQMPYGGGFRRDPGLPRNVPIRLLGRDATWSSEFELSQVVEKQFIQAAERVRIENNIGRAIACATGLKVLKGNELTLSKDDVANLIAGLALKLQNDSVFASVATLVATANAELISCLTAQTLPDALYSRSLHHDWMAAKAKGAQNFLEFRNRWSAQHPASLFYDSATRLLGNTSGEPLPPMVKMAQGVVYVVPKNFMKNTHDENLAKHLAEKGYTAGDLFYIKSKRMEDGRPISNIGRIEYARTDLPAVVAKASSIHMQAKGLLFDATP